MDVLWYDAGMQHGLMNKFSIADYGVLLCMLVISCGIGMFYGFFGQKQKTSSDFLLGGSQMGTYPMALSLAARYVVFDEYKECNISFMRVPFGPKIDQRLEA